MRAFLHKDLRLSGNTLLDTTLGLRYSLTPDAAWLLGRLVTVSRIDSLVATVAVAKSLSPEEAKRVIYSLLGQLGAYGAVVVEWGYSFNFGLRWRARLSWLTRQGSSCRGLAHAAWRAYGLVFLGFELAFVAFGIMYGLWLPFSWLVASPVVFASLTIHELGHVIMAKLRRVPTALLSKFGYLALIYKRPEGSSAQHIAAAGPLLAVAACSLGAIMAHGWLARWGLLAVGLAHFMCLLPFTADGRTLWRRIK